MLYEVITLPALLDHGRGQSVAAVESLVAEAIAVGEPGLVDRLVLPGMHPHHFVAAQMQIEVGAQTVVSYNFV